MSTASISTSFNHRRCFSFEKVCHRLNELVRSLSSLLLTIELAVTGRRLLRSHNLPPPSDLLKELKSRTQSRNRNKLDMTYERSYTMPYGDFPTVLGFYGNLYVQMRMFVYVSLAFPVFQWAYWLLMCGVTAVTLFPERWVRELRSSSLISCILIPLQKVDLCGHGRAWTSSHFILTLQ